MIQWETSGRVGLATIDRQERRNALNAELCDDLRGYVQSSSGLRAVVITGAGKAFCAGADLVTRSGDAAGTSGHGGGDTFRPAFERVLEALVEFPGPVIAAINGAALGAGLQLAVACDLRVAAPGAVFGIPAARLGVLLNASNIQRLALLVGQGPAREILLTGRTLDLDEARAVGLVNRVAGDAAAGALAWAGEIAALAPLTVAGHKRALNLVAEAQGLQVGPDANAIAELRALEDRAFRSRDLREGLAAFAEKRPPEFEGR
ncbi:MAG: enoyl-CoA hydratase-related protein [Acidimicrobiia bacterium]